MTEPHPLRRRHLELIAIDTDRDRQTRHLAIFFPDLDPDNVLPKLADYRHHMVMEDHDAAHETINDLLDQDQEART